MDNPLLKSGAKVSPEAFMAIMLDDVSKSLRSIDNLLKESRLEGLSEGYEIEATTTKQEIRPPAGKKWHSISVLNRGNSAVYVGANVGWVNAIIIPKNGSHNLDMKRALIEYVNFRTASGTANVTFTGIR